MLKRKNHFLLRQVKISTVKMDYRHFELWSSDTLTYCPFKGTVLHQWSCSIFLSFFTFFLWRWFSKPISNFSIYQGTNEYIKIQRCVSMRCVYGKQTLGVSGLPNGESSREFSLSEELLWRCWANFLLSASAIRAAGSLSNAAPPLLRLLLTGVPPGDLQRKEGKMR